MVTKFKLIDIFCRFQFIRAEHVENTIFDLHFRQFWVRKKDDKSFEIARDGPDDRLMLIKKIKLLIARPAFLFSSFYLSLPICLIVSFYFLLNSRTKQTWPLRTPRWCQSSLMSAWLIGRNFINARSIEISDDIEEVRGYRTVTRFYASTRVFIKYDDCSHGTTPGNDALVSEKSIGRLYTTTFLNL